MQLNYESSRNLKQDSSEIIEVKLWGLYLLVNRVDVISEMIEASLDHGPVEKNPQKPGRVTFRFSAKAWESKIKKLLYSSRVPVIIKSQAYQRAGVLA